MSLAGNTKIALAGSHANTEMDLWYCGARYSCVRYHPSVPQEPKAGLPNSAGNILVNLLIALDICTFAGSSSRRTDKVMESMRR